MTNNRSRIEIVSQILDIVNGHGYDGVTETKIMYDVYLSGGQLREYLVALSVHGLLIYDSSMHRYNITRKGLRFLGLYDKIENTMTEEDQELKI